MRIDRLELRRFGPFSDVVLDLSAGRRGLHLIYGPNEAGKTSLLRALRQLYFGIDARVRDNWRFAYDELRIGASLRRRDGATLEIVRRKGNRKTLRGGNDDDVVAEEDLQRFLGGMDRPTFEAAFGIGHASLKEGGAAIAKGEGELGQILFAAASGVSEVRVVQQQLDKEAEDLFVRAGRVRVIPLALTEYKARKDEEKQALLSAEDWHAVDQKLGQAKEKAGRVAEELRRDQRECHRLTRLRQAQPHVLQRRNCLEQLQPLETVVRLPEDFGDRRRQAEIHLELSSQQERAAAAELAALAERLDRLASPDRVLDREKEIETLKERLGSYRKANKDRDGIESRLKFAEHEVRDILRELRRPVDLDRVEELRLGADLPRLVQRLAKEQVQLAAERDRSAKEIRQREQKLARERAAASPAEELFVDPAALRAAIPRLQREVALVEQLAQQRSALGKTTREVDGQLRRLSGWTGSIEDLEALLVPDVETVRRWERDLEAAAAAADEAGKEFRRVKTEHRKAERDLERSLATRSAPTMADLHAARGLRTQGWELIQQVWRDQKPGGAAEQAYLAESPGADLGAAFAASIDRADAVADHLLREADHVARVVQLKTDVRTFAEERNQLQAFADAAATRVKELNHGWAALWKPIGVEPSTPREMLAWLGRHTSLFQSVGSLREQEFAAAQLEERLATAKREVHDALSRIGGAAERNEETLPALLDHAATIVKAHDERRRQREDAARRIADLENEIAADLASVEDAARRLADWSQFWCEAMARLGLPASASFEQAEGVLQSIQLLFTKMDARKVDVVRLRGIDRDAEEFRQDAAALAVALERIPIDQPVERLVADVYERLREARAADQERRQLKEQIATEEKKRIAAHTTVLENNFTLLDLRRLAKVESTAGLIDAEELSRQCRHWDGRREQLEEILLGLCGGALLEDFAAEAERIDPEEIGRRIEELEARVASLERERSEIDQVIGAAGGELRTMEQAAATAAEASQKAELLLAGIAAEARKFALLRLASMVLREGVERYRASREGAVLERAKALFAQLTCGSFSGLRVDYDEDGRPALLAVRPGNGPVVRMEGLSDGAADQLYLALRLASLEAYLDDPAHEPMPFVVDDVLLTFDDERAVAALRAFADLSQKTQVLFLTHHRHLVDLAAGLKSEQIFHHSLGSSTAAFAPAAAKPHESRPKRKLGSLALFDDGSTA